MGDEHQFCLRWNNHQATLISVFDTLLEKGVHVDCTLAAEGQTLKAHKVVLSACSPYFEAVLGQQYDKHPIIILKDVKFAELRAMMDYMYRGEVNISQEQLGALLKAAESLQIKGLSDSKPPPQINSTPEIPQPLPCKIGATRSTSPVRSGSREGSVSPTRRKRKKRRTSDSPTPLLHNNNPPTPPDSHLDQMAKIKLLTPKDESDKSPPTPSEPPNDSAILEPKAESCEARDDTTDDLTLDEGAYSDVEHNGPGTSQSLPDMSGQGYGWHMDRSQDENASQEGPRDSADTQIFQIDIPVIDLDLEATFLTDSDNGNIPGPNLEVNPMFSLLQACPRMESVLSEESPTVPGAAYAKKMLEETFLQNNNFIMKHENVGKFVQKCESDGDIDDLDDIVLPDESEVFGVGNIGIVDEAVRRSRGRNTIGEPHQQFVCRHCGKKYRWKSTLRRHESVECGGKPPSHACPYCVYRAKQRGNLGVHIRKHHNTEWNIFANSKLRKSKKIDV